MWWFRNGRNWLTVNWRNVWLLTERNVWLYTERNIWLYTELNVWLKHWKEMLTIKCYVNEWNRKLNEQGTEMKLFKEMFDWNY